MTKVKTLQLTQFSQQSLQDYVDCPRRFQLRYIDRVAWPTARAEPLIEHEQHMQRGTAFHRMVHQTLIGVPEARLSRMVGDDEALARWWQHYLEHQPAHSALSTHTNNDARYPEITLTAPLRDHRLVAKYDLIVTDSAGHAMILDWKTGLKRPRRVHLASRLQTRVYLYLLVRAGAYLVQHHADSQPPPLDPENVAMLYWFAEFPHEPERFAYTAERYEADGDYLASLITEIEARVPDEDFPLTDNAHACKYCPYRSLCDRGIEAADFSETEQDLEEDEALDLDIDFEQIAEIAF